MPMVFGPSLRALLEDMMELLTRELLKILLQERLLDENQGKYDLTDQVNIDLGGGRCSEQKGAGAVLEMGAPAQLLEAHSPLYPPFNPP